MVRDKQKISNEIPFNSTQINSTNVVGNLVQSGGKSLPKHMMIHFNDAHMRLTWVNMANKIGNLSQQLWIYYDRCSCFVHSWYMLLWSYADTIFIATWWSLLKTEEQLPRVSFVCKINLAVTYNDLPDITGRTSIRCSIGLKGKQNMSFRSSDAYMHQ